MPSGPSILWIVTTQWRAQALGYSGDPNARTPHLDALARQSIDFSQATTPHPFGPFARAALLTGVPSPANGVVTYFDPLPRNSRTVAHDLAARGYATGFIGKWHLAPRDADAALVGDAHARTPVASEDRGGFEFWEGFEGGFLLNDPWLHGTGFPELVRFRGYQSDILVERATRWMAQAAPPWFCMVSLEAPHPPYDAPAPQVALPAPESLVLAPNVPRGTEVESKARRELSGYYAHIEATDRAIGRLLRSTPREARILFTSVHGDMHGAHGLFRKGWPHEESVRVPLLWREPGGPAGIRDPSLISLLDLRGLMAAPAGSRPAVGRSAAPISMPSVVGLPHQCDRIWQGRRSAEEKLIYDGAGKPWLEFDLKNDPFERRNRV